MNIFEQAIKEAHHNTNPNKFIKVLNKYKDEDWIGLGGRRAVFRRKSYVVKVPFCWGGLEDNQSEALQYSKSKKSGDIPFAACKMAGKMLLIMEYVTPIELDANTPVWCCFVDCGQVGLDRSGRLVAYDYSNVWS